MTTSKGTNPSRVTIKPFCEKLQLMSVILHSVSLNNKRILNLQNVNLIDKFNSCVTLQYSTISGLKQQCGMGWHCDSKYSKKGKFLLNTNSQMINTPVVIFTIGLPRILKWRKRCLLESSNGNEIWNYDKSNQFKMLLEQGSMLVIHPDDEVPKYCPVDGAISNFQHGEVKFKEKQGMSIAYVFRSTTSIGIFDKTTNLWVQNHNNVTPPKDIYSNIDVDKFHENMISKLGHIV